MIKKFKFVPQQGSPIVFLGKILYSHNALYPLPDVKCWFLRREENRRTRRKTPGVRARTNNKLKPRMAPGPGIRTRDTLVVGGRCHHCSTPAPLNFRHTITQNHQVSLTNGVSGPLSPNLSRYSVVHQNSLIQPHFDYCSLLWDG